MISQPARLATAGPAGFAGLALATAAMVAAALMVAAGAPARAAARPVSRCTRSSGIIMAVDFGHWGGPVLRACGSAPATGYALINQGGWQTAGTEHDGPGFVCRIGYAGYRHGVEYPTPAQQPCVVTPPVNAYWSLWQAGPGQDRWAYSQGGAMSLHAAAGSVELWSFGGTNLAGTAGSAVPAISPDQLRDLSAARAGSGLRVVNAPPVTAAGAGGSGGPAGGAGSPYPTVVALAIAALLAAAAVTVSRRRARPAR